MHGKAMTCHGNIASVANGRYISLGLGAHSYNAQARPLVYGIAMHGARRPCINSQGNRHLSEQCTAMSTDMLPSSHLEHPFCGPFETVRIVYLLGYMYELWDSEEHCLYVACASCRSASLESNASERSSKVNRNIIQ
jgi:hypothetical protein